jgi:transcriptional regulator with XRE-family HTH domain
MKESDATSINTVIGSNIRYFRRIRSQTQKFLADELGITFQQIQKYERGSNRVSASMLFEIARILSVNVVDFFKNNTSPITSVAIAEPRNMIKSNSPSHQKKDVVNSKEIELFVKGFCKLSPKQKKVVTSMMQEMLDAR